MSEPFIAEVKIFAGNFAPRGYAFCDGQLLQISQHTALFSLVGTIYGGDGRTTMALPNLQGRAPMHAGRGPGLTPRQLGERGGTETITLNSNQLPSHTHGFEASTDPPDARNPGNALAGTPAGRGATVLYGNDSPVAMDPRTVSSFGDGQAHDNLQPYLTLNYIIALVGVYPMRN
jgi:microcystin-dependent protein